MTCAIFLKRILFEDLKNNVPRCLTSKYTNTNTQIHKYTNTVWAKIINNNIIIIIQLQKQFPELCSKQLLFFLFDIHNNMFPNIVKKILLKKIENCKCYKGYSSDHQAIIKRSSNYKSEFPNFAQNNFWFFDLIFTIICFPTLSKKFF